MSARVMFLYFPLLFYEAEIHLDLDGSEQFGGI
jgi:hypothetical protein